VEEILVAIIHFIFELVMEVLLNFPFDLPSKNRSSPEPETIWPVCIMWFVCAFLLGLASLYFFKHSLINNPSLRIANLVLAPLISACLSQKIAAHRAQKNHFIVPRNHYWQAFWFTLSFTMVRYAYTSHT